MPISALTNVLHIGAAAGEINFYSTAGVTRLAYAEPDAACLVALAENIKHYRTYDSGMYIQVVPKACSSKSGEILSFYANGMGQSSLEKPESRTISMADASFERYYVETINLPDLKALTFGESIVHYCCIDTQGHEMAIICNVDPDYLRKNFLLIDVELMTDPSQYSIPLDNWRHVALHLLMAGFEPVIHPHGITESYIFINSSLAPLFTPYIALLKERIMDEYFAQNTFASEQPSGLSCCSLGDHMFLPLSRVGGSIHASQLQSFRQQFIACYLSCVKSFSAIAL